MTTPQAANQATADAANLLLRIGLFVAFVVVPLALLVSPRSIFILSPIAGALVFAGGLVLSPRMRMNEIFAFLFSRIGLAGVFIGLWCLISLLWTPFPAEAGPRLLKLVSTFLAVLPVAAALPARSKAANLYLLPLGVAAAAFGAIFAILSLSAQSEEIGDNENLIRATEMMLLLLWPALAAATLRNRLTLAAALGIVVLAVAVTIRLPAALGATGIAALAYALALADQKTTGRWIGVLGAVSFLFAPALPLLLGPFFDLDAIAPLAGLKVWHNVLIGDGVRILTGHGFSYVASGGFHSYLPPLAPQSMLFEVWTDLGIVGAAGTAALVYLCYEAAAAQSPRVAPYWIGGLTYVTALGVFGGATVQLWWITALALSLAGYAVAMRGDYKTDRPTAPKRVV